MILKFGTKLDSDEMYCVTKKQLHIAYQSLYLFIFLSFQLKFPSQISQLLLEPVFQILCTPSGRQSVLCKWKIKMQILILPSFLIFHFFLLSLLYNTSGHFSSEISQQLLDLGFCNMVQSLIVMNCIV